MRPLRSFCHAARLLGILLAMPLTGGCEYVLYDLDAVVLQDAGGWDVGEKSDVGDGGGTTAPDAGDAADGGDAGDAGDAGDVRPPTPMCERDFPAEPGSCNPANNDPCPAGRQCKLVGGPVVDGVPQLVLGCPETNTGTGTVGSPCTSARSQCLPDLECVNWRLEPDPRPMSCTTFCELETGLGCADDEFCTKAHALIDANMDGYGFCTLRCDPYDPQACAEGQTCSVDYNYPEHTCLPEFRCVVSDAPGRTEGQSCVPDERAAMCARGLVCLEQLCVKPCQADADCGGDSCGAPATDFALRYCQ